MHKYKVATNKTQLAQADKIEGCPIVESLEQVGDLLHAAGYEGCSVWRYEARAKHWRLIFDRSLPDSSRLPGAEHWANCARHEAGVKA